MQDFLTIHHSFSTCPQDDLLILPKELARNLSNISRLVLAKRIGSGIHVIDPLTGEVRPS